MKLRVTVTDEDGFVLDMGEVEVTETVCTVCVRLCGPGKVDACSDLDLNVGRLEVDNKGAK